MRIFMWHVHGTFTTSLVQGPHTYLLPVLPDRSEDGLGRLPAPGWPRSWEWPATVQELSRVEAATAQVDIVILQRPRELFGLAKDWLGGRSPGTDIPAVYLELNAPRGIMPYLPHPARNRPDLTLVHVSAFNNLLWDAGTTPTYVINLGISDPTYLYRGIMQRAVAVINEPVRRARAMGVDLLGRMAPPGSVDLFGKGASAIGGFEALPQHELHREMALRRLYIHSARWTALGFSLIEAMAMGMPVVAVATTEVVEAVAPGAGIVSTDVVRLKETALRLLHDRSLAQAMGMRARDEALQRYGLRRFLDAWDDLFTLVSSAA